MGFNSGFKGLKNVVDTEQLTNALFEDKQTNPHPTFYVPQSARLGLLQDTAKDYQ